MNTTPFNAEYDELVTQHKLKISGGMSKSASPEQWANTFGDITPAQIYEKFAKAGGPENEVRVRISLPEKKDKSFSRIEVRHNATWHMGDRENILLFDIYPDKTAKLDRAFFTEKKQGANLAKRYLRAGVELLRDVGSPALKISPLEVGGYAWVKYGFTPATPADWEKLKYEIKWRLSDKDSDVLFENKHYNIAPERKAVEAILKADFADLPNVLPELTALNRRIGTYRNNKPLTVGKALLIGTEWEGILPLDDKHVSFQRFNSYTASAVEQLQQVG